MQNKLRTLALVAAMGLAFAIGGCAKRKPVIDLDAVSRVESAASRAESAASRAEAAARRAADAAAKAEAAAEKAAGRFTERLRK